MDSDSKLLVEESHDLPLVRVQAVLRRGAAEDAPGTDGLANYATELMGRGAGGKDRAALDAAFDAIGSSLDIATDADAISFEVSVLAEHLDQAMNLMADVMLRPSFDATEADKLQRDLTAQLDEVRDDDGSVARRFFQHQLYGKHPYGRSALGTDESLPRLAVAPARAWYQRNLTTGNLVYGAAGAISEKDAAAAFARHFEAVPKGPAPVAADLTPPALRSSPRLTIVDKPERTQSQILMGHQAPHFSDPLFLPLLVGTTAFGGTFTARLMDEVRSKRGLSYGASARVGQGRGAKSWVLHVFPSLAQTAETLTLVLGLCRTLADEGLTDKEVDFARSYLSKGFAFSMATPEDRLDLKTAVELSGLPSDYHKTFAERIRNVSGDEVRRAIRAHLHPESFEVVVVSTADALRPLLDKDNVFPSSATEVVAFDSY